MQKVSFISILLFLFIVSCTSVQVKHISKVSSKKNTIGFYYYLPQTVIIVDVDVKKTDKIKGPYANYASKYLGLTNVILANSTNYEITQININTIAEPDTAQLYFVDLKNHRKFGKCEKLLAQMTENGLLMGINETKDFTDNDLLKLDRKESIINNVSDLSLIPVSSNLFEKTDTIIEKVHLDTNTIEKKVLKKTLIEKSIEQRAKETAELIVKIKEAKFNLISGYAEVNYNKETLQMMIDELDKLENDYLTLFTGMTNSQVIRYRFNFAPRSEIASIPAPLFWYSSKSGVTDSSSEEGEPMYIIVQKKYTTKGLQSFLKEKEEKRSSKNGYYYRIPEMAQVIISQGNAIRSSAPVMVAQFGAITCLPIHVKRFEFYHKYGSIRKMEFSND